MKRCLGLTLLELLICLVLLAALLAISLPNFEKQFASVSGEVTLRRLAKAIQLGKSSAIADATTVTLCRSADALTCGGSWQEGVIIFTDHNNDREINDDDRLVRHITFPDNAGRIKFRAFQNKQYLQLTRLGSTRYQNGNFTYCPNFGDRSLARQLIINRTARLRFAQDGNNDGIREDSRGRPLNCD